MTTEMNQFHRTTTTFRQGSFTMPAAYYLSPEIFAEESERIGLTQWHCVGRADRVAEPGDYYLCSIAGESLIIVRDRSGDVRAHFNVCRHRGTRLCSAEAGRFSGSIQCPYHAWTFGVDGRLLGAPHMQDVEGFVKSDYGLHSARVATWEGFLFVNLDSEAQPFEVMAAPLVGRLSRFGLDRLRSGHRVRYEIRSNWKLIYQNYSECLHCPMIHPELSCRLPYQSGANDLVEGPYLGGYMEIVDGAESVTTSGRYAARLIADLSPDDRRRAYYYTVMPNLMLSIHPDYVNYYTVWPVSAEQTVVESEWLFHPEAFDAPDFHPEDAIAMWDVTNRQDWQITEESLLGIKSRRYQPGPYSARESMPAAWDRAYLDLMGRAA
ncbi:MAG: aromatic ring-hydroxylating dioxygenase subunit alpha [Gemmatimonadales bacterium]|nr:aromatic ring-hydroxylating dioxygenase subunit alpha [Gemmatimonadales bacterium]